MRLLATLLLCLCIPLAWAAEANAPKLDTGKGGECVKDTQWMRKNHMHMLKHQRNETVRKGVRVEAEALKACVECHASTQDDSVTARADSFCVGCHRYAAVKIDCFECHASKRKEALANKDVK
ncbi:MAG: Hdr-like menaquinol oxidoreductase cytochrome c subunit [Gammaproteobacteria bacterium]|nr:Hdr-like menaquinol oxidoreductase cytochrome c subunit [Gammaproteobacteria bacterium]MBU1775079.1 Hdr-like menaquinol oxidoreductase cytochrome c subunit [Gammaproteobacteria bacterium]MBU1969955.1 Hdr-like menaquinol oxidoreductase cytochrome c subunit [Gammaproteobacteria bacterium]